MAAELVPPMAQAPLRLSPLSAASLRNDAVVIGPVLPEDMGALFLWLNDRDAANLDLTYRPIDWLNYKTWLETLANDSVHTFFAVRRLIAPEIIGFVFFKNFQPVHRSAEVGTRIGTEADRGKGYGRHAMALALIYAFNHLNLHRVTLTVLARNTRAIRAYRASGFVEEGVLRQAAFIDGRWEDVVPMAVIGPN